MRQFIKTTVPTEGYMEVKQIGAKYIVHIDGVDNQDGTTTCYECMTDGEPDMAELHQELAEYKEHISGVKLRIAKEVKIKELEAYDKSDAVNAFTLGGRTMWLTVEERQQLATQISANGAMGRTEMTKYYGDVPYTFTLAVWQQMLMALEVYAGDARNVTDGHRAAIHALQTVENVDNYDFQTGYPAKLNF